MDRVRKTSTEENLGARMYQITRQRAVERSIDRLRAGMKADWHYLTGEDVENLRWLAGEIWATRDRAEWETLHFSKVDLHDARVLSGHADRLRRHHTQRNVTLAASVDILRNAAERARRSEFLTYADEAAAQA